MLHRYSLISFGIALVLLCLGGGTPAYAAVVSHSEVHVSNIQITPASGSLKFYSDPWITTAGAGAFDDPSGWSRDYDDDSDGNGEAAASAATTYHSKSAAASANNMTIDVVSNSDTTGGGLFAASGYGFGELYNVFEISGDSPVDVTFSLDYFAEIFAVASADSIFDLDYGIELLISDSENEWSLSTLFQLSGSGTQSHSDAVTLADTFTLLPDTFYSISILAILDWDLHPVPEPGTLALLGFGLAGLLLGCKCRRRRRTNLPLSQ